MFIKMWYKTNMYTVRSGENNPNAKLTKEQVKQIRLLSMRKNGKINKFGKVDHTWLGEKFGVSARTISSILTRSSWSSYTDLLTKWDY